LPQSHDAKDFTFYLATLNHLLTEIQRQAILEVHQEQAIFQASPSLLARAIKKYCESLNPITQTENQVSFLIQVARFVCDLTLGDCYLTEEEHFARIKSYVDGLSAFSYENLSKLTEENWADFAGAIGSRPYLWSWYYQIY
jgi:hypothetical protein